MMNQSFLRFVMMVTLEISALAGMAVPKTEDIANCFRAAKAKPADVSTLPGLERLRTPGSCAYAALQFGPTQNDVLYLIADCAKMGGRYDRLFVHVPGHRLYGNTQQLRGSRRQDTIQYRNIAISGLFDEARVGYKLKITIDPDWDADKVKWLFEASCDLSASGRRQQFDLIATKLVRIGRSDLLKTILMMDKPVLDVSWDRRSAPPSVRCAVEFGDFHADLGKTRASLQIKTALGEVVEKASVYLRPAGTKYETRYQLRRTPKQRGAYSANMTVDLPLFGVTNGTDTGAL